MALLPAGTGHLVKRCRYCNELCTPTKIEEQGHCDCGSRSFRVAGKISDEEERALLAMGYRFDPAQWTEDPSQRWIESTDEVDAVAAVRRKIARGQA